jgi:hypothetical protein
LGLTRGGRAAEWDRGSFAMRPASRCARWPKQRWNGSSQRINRWMRAVAVRSITAHQRSEFDEFVQCPQNRSLKHSRMNGAIW